MNIYVFNYKGRSLHISNKLLAEFVHYLYGALNESTVNVYIRNRYGFDPGEDPDKLGALSNEEIEAAITEGMQRDIEAFIA